MKMLRVLGTIGRWCGTISWCFCVFKGKFGARAEGDEEAECKGMACTVLLRLLELSGSQLILG